MSSSRVSKRPPLINRRQFLAGLSAVSVLIPSVALGQTLNLTGGGYVIYFRHGATTWSGIDRLEWPRERQRLLSAEGIRQSEIIGAAFRERNIPVGEVLASPFARCRDMAEIAFGRVEERMELAGLLSDTEGRNARIAYLRSRLTEPPRNETNRVIVAHRSNIAAVANVTLAEGEAVITRPDQNALGFTSVGTVSPDAWMQL